MPFCTECGTEVKPGTKFCTNCGASITARSPAKPSAQPARTPQPEAAPVERQPSRAPERVEAPAKHEAPRGPAKSRTPLKINPKILIGAVVAILIIAVAAFAFAGGPPVITTTTPTTTTSTSPFTDLTDGLVFYEGSLPEITQVTYFNRDHNEISNVNAYAGLIVLLVEAGTPEYQVADAVTALDGVLVMELPAAGIYWADVGAGYEPYAIIQAREQSWVINAFPLTPITLSGELTSVDAERPTGWFWDAYDTHAFDSDIVMIDGWSNDASPAIDAGNGQDHGATTSDIASGGSVQSEAASKTEVDIYHQPAGTGPGDLNMSAIVPSIMLAAMNANERDRVTAINLSINANTGLDDGNDHHGLTDAATVRGQELEQNYLEGIFQAMETMGQPYLDHVLVNISTGNAGLDLTAQYSDLKSRYPNAWNHVIMAGGLDGNNNRFPLFNSSENPDDVLYAQMPDGLVGTSFAAPQFTSLVAALAAERPDLKSGDLKRAILEAAPVISTYRTMPTLEQALTKANELFPPTTTTTTSTTTTTTTSTTTTPGSALEGDWGGYWSATHTESTDTYVRNSGGWMTWSNIYLDGDYFEADLDLDGIMVLDTSTGDFMWYSDASGTVTGTFTSETTVEGTLSFSVPGTVSPPREWYFTGRVVFTPGYELLDGDINGSASGTVYGEFNLGPQ